MMRVSILVALVGTALVLTGPTFAFDEQSRQSSVGAPSQSLDGSSSTRSPGRSGGASLELPGLGNLGVIPKLDFGLELLYGDRRSAAAEVEPGVSPDDDSLRVRGTIRHRF